MHLVADTTKGKITKDYFLEVGGRLNTKINITQALTTMVSRVMVT